MLNYRKICITNSCLYSYRIHISMFFAKIIYISIKTKSYTKFSRPANSTSLHQFKIQKNNFGNSTSTGFFTNKILSVAHKKPAP